MRLSGRQAITEDRPSSESVKVPFRPAGRKIGKCHEQLRYGTKGHGTDENMYALVTADGIELPVPAWHVVV
jgi:hypothetical protein